MNDVEALADRMHDAYEAAAADAGWETQQRSRVAWTDVPEANKAAMRAMIRAVVVPELAKARADALAPILALAREWAMGHGPGSDPEAYGEHLSAVVHRPQPAAAGVGTDQEEGRR